MPTYDYSCEECDLFWDTNVPYEDREKQLCGECGTLAKYHFPKGGIMKASYPDGHKRKGFAEMKEARKLEIQAAHCPSNATRNEIAKEIKTIRRTKK